MRPLTCLAAVLSIAATPLAHANIYNFSFTGSDDELDGLGIPNSYSESFAINTSVLIAPTADDGFACANPSDNCFVTGTEGAYYIVNRDGLIQEDSEIGETDTSLYISFDDTYPAKPFQLFTGLSTAPVIATGTFYGYEDSGVSYNPEGPITITDPPSAGSSPVPEPSTLALLGTGALTLAGTLRRRFLA